MARSRFSGPGSRLSLRFLFPAVLAFVAATSALYGQAQPRATVRALLDQAAKAEAAFRFGVRWALRHQNPELGAELLEEALRLDPTREAAFTYLRDAYGARTGDWERLIRLADEVSDRAGANASAGYLLANAGLLAWREQGDLMKARRFFERLGVGSGPSSVAGMSVSEGGHAMGRHPGGKEGE